MSFVSQKMVDELKKQLGAARAAASTAGAKTDDKRKGPSRHDGASHSTDRRGKEEEVVILSRTNRMGQSYPLPEEAGQRPEKGGKKRRKNKGVWDVYTYTWKIFYIIVPFPFNKIYIPNESSDTNIEVLKRHLKM